MIDHTCPNCGAQMSSPDSSAGLAETCPECGSATTIPEAGGAGLALAATPGAGLSRRGLLIVCVAVGALVVAGVVAWVFMPAAVDRALKYAPPNAVGLLHIDVEKVAADVFEELREHKDELGEISDADLAEIEKLVSKIDSSDAFFSFPSGGKGPEVVGVLRTSLTPGDIMKLQRKFGTRSATLEKTGNGRYDASAADERTIFGAEADDLDEGIVLLGTKGVLTDEFVAELGTGDNSKLRKMLADLDTSAPVWVAVAMDFLDEADAPASITGALDPRGGGSGQVVMTFRAQKYAENFVRDADDEDFPLAGAFDTTRDGAVVTVKIKGEGSFVGKIFSMFSETRRLARRALTLSNLHVLANDVQIWAVQNEGRMPPDLKAVLAHSGRDKLPRSPASRSGPGADVPDYIYIKLPRLSQIPRPRETIMIYERPENYGGKGTYAAFADGRVEWVEIDRFKELLRRSKALSDSGR